MSEIISLYTTFSGFTAGQTGTDATSHNIANASTQQLSSLEDVDIAEAVIELQLQETAYEAARAAFARSAQTSLVDFLR